MEDIVMDLFPMNSTLMRRLLGETAAPASLTIRPAQNNDIDLILEMHQRLSDDSLYNRYHIARIPSRKEIERIIDLEGENGRVMVAAILGAKPKIVGLAYYVVTGQDTAETAFLVEDMYQGQGIGGWLMEALTRSAATQEICFFDARVLPSNQPMIHLLHRSGQLVYKKKDYGAFEMRLDICAVSG
jgi:ribosomal protein S18 acetylase RimI-like enzyme